MQILAVNTGSSSVKFKLVSMPKKQILIQGQMERIGIDGSIQYRTGDGPEVKTDAAIPDYQSAFCILLDLVSKFGNIDAIGHRVAHGGNCYAKSTRITDTVVRAIEENSRFAPLHNRANLMGIHACITAFGNEIPQVAAFDTGFHTTMPKYAYMYSIPYEYYEKYGIRRFGFHGLSHRYISGRCAELMEKKDLKVITCHLGNGCSLAAVKNGISIDTSMGLTPNEGCMMGTRSGNIDPAILDYIAKQENCSYEDVLDICNQKSGLLGVSGISNDYRDLSNSGEDRAALALEMQKYQLVKIVGSYLAAMDGADAIVFSGGIGTHAVRLRAGICESLSYAGVILDSEANAVAHDEMCISAPESKISVYVIPTDEEMMIAMDTYHLLSGTPTV